MRSIDLSGMNVADAGNEKRREPKKWTRAEQS
jgi:hypothetical protein